MKLWNSLKIAFAMYSKIPVCKADWEKEKMPYVLCCFPLVGAVIGLLVYAWYLLAGRFAIGDLMRAAGAVMIPVFVTGGIHLDGFLDTMDAWHSYQPKEEKLRILSDPHTGAFAVIGTVGLFICNLGIWSDLSQESVACLLPGFVLSRALSGFSVAVFPCAKNTGLASMFQSVAHRKTVAVVCVMEAVAVTGVLVFLSPLRCICMVLAAFGTLLFYRQLAGKQFGGITGDLAGWFLQTCECVMALAVWLGDTVWFS